MTTNDEQYVPHESYVRHRYISGVADVHDTPEWEGGAEFDRFLACVRRDAARGVIDGLIADKAHMTALLRAEKGGEAEDALAHFRDTLHPEPFSWTEAEDARRLQRIADGDADLHPEETP